LEHAIRSIILRLQQIQELSQNYSLTVGFDGFIDKIIRAVKCKSGSSRSYFEYIDEFGKHLSSKNGMSCSVEYTELNTKLGGNMPILSNALGNLGFKVNCIGAMGFPEIQEVFKVMSPNCTLFSVEEPGVCSAIEFKDGKIMLAGMDSINALSWDRLKSILGMELINKLFQESKLVAMVNWSEMDNATSIWEGIQRDLVEGRTQDSNKIIYFDLADCSARSREDILKVLEIIKSFKDYYRVILGLNLNEAGILYSSIYGKDNTADTMLLVEAIGKYLDIHAVVIHTKKYSAAWSSSKCTRIDTMFIEHPKLSTGVGDNFNAGFCCGQVLGLDIESSLMLGNTVSAFYLQNGHSPNNAELIDFLNNVKDKWEDVRK
jgi:hypothetical protein